MQLPCFVCPTWLSKQFKKKSSNSYGKIKLVEFKRSVIFQPLSHGGLNFPHFRTQVKSLRLSWLGRLLHSSNEIESWQAIPNEYFNQHGGLAFLLKCNYDTKININIYKYNVQLGFMQYFQLLAAIPSDLKKQAFASTVPERSILGELDVFHLSKEKTIMLTKLRCRDYYKLFQDKMKNETIPAAIKAWSKRFPNQSQDWNKSFENIYHTTADNKLGEFTFKLIHRILVTNKELKRFIIRDEDLCPQFQRADSLEHTFLDCPVCIKFYEEIISWFKQKNKTKIILSNEELLFQSYELPPSLLPLSRRQLTLLVLLAKKYLYACKFTEARPDYSQFVTKLQDQWKIEHLS